MSFETVERLYQRGLFEAIDLEFARCIARLPVDAKGTSKRAHELVVLAAAFASRSAQAGHICLELPHLLGTPLLDESGEILSDCLPSLKEWRAALASSPWVENASAVADEERKPLVFANDLVYLQRLHDYERRLADALIARAAATVECDLTLLQSGTETLFPSSTADWQAAAAVIAVRSNLAVISGGPGTGKTTTVARILALLAEQPAFADSFRVTLVAPTGKAAQRLSQSIAASAERLSLSDSVKQSLLQPASTIHRVLGYQSRSPNTFLHNAENPISADIVVVDEASMVDLGLMTKLVEAVPLSARLILLGDKDQLASVEAGAIFGDIYNSDVVSRYRAPTRELLKRLARVTTAAGESKSALRDTSVHLMHNYRYGPDSSISTLAEAIRGADLKTARSTLSQSDGSVHWLLPHQVEHQLETTLREGYTEYSEAQGPAARLAALRCFRALSAHRQGPYSVARLNTLAETVLGFPAARETFYCGRPIMISVNDYALELFNGDIGVIERDAESGDLYAFFEDAQGLRRVHPARLPPHETAFAMTVHKSQGSEFERVAVLLPEKDSALLTRELLYTAITRARSRVSVHASWEILEACIGRGIQRASGLKAKLWGATAEANSRA